jgi:Lysozyme like domain
VTTYTYAQLEQLWINAGGSSATAPVAAAIAEAESSGNSAAVNATDNNGTQTSWGLWQISNGTHNQPVPNILDPTVNAAAAVAKYQASGWSPWGTYSSGAYLPHLANNVPPSSAGVPAGTAVLTAATGSVGAPVPGCMIAPPSFSFAGLTIGGGCIFTKSEARALIGGLVLTAAGLIMIPAVIILVAAGFRATGAGGALSSAAAPLEATPGYGQAIRYARRRRAPRAAPAPPAGTRARG